MARTPPGPRPGGRPSPVGPGPGAPAATWAAADLLALNQWLRRLHDCLRADTSLQMLEHDGAGFQVLQALRLQCGGRPQLARGKPPDPDEPDRVHQLGAHGAGRRHLPAVARPQRSSGDHALDTGFWPPFCAHRDAWRRPPPRRRRRGTRVLDRRRAGPRLGAGPHRGAAGASAPGPGAGVAGAQSHHLATPPRWRRDPERERSRAVAAAGTRPNGPARLATASLARPAARGHLAPRSHARCRRRPTPCPRSSAPPSSKH